MQLNRRGNNSVTELQQSSPVRNRNTDSSLMSPKKNATVMGYSQINFMNNAEQNNLSTIQPMETSKGRSYIDAMLPQAKNISNASTHQFTDVFESKITL